MSSEDTPALADIDIEETAGGIEGASSHIVTGAIEIDAPDGLSVVLEGKGAGGVHEVPYFDCTITRACEDVMSTGVELHGADPIAMTFS